MRIGEKRFKEIVLAHYAAGNLTEHVKLESVKTKTWATRHTRRQDYETTYYATLYANDAFGIYIRIELSNYIKSQRVTSSIAVSQYAREKNVTPEVWLAVSFHAAKAALIVNALNERIAR